MKKIILVVIFGFLVILLDGCLYLEMSTDEIIIAANVHNTVLFEENEKGYTNNKHFLVTTNKYLYEEKSIIIGRYIRIFIKIVILNYYIGTIMWLLLKMKVDYRDWISIKT